MLGMRQDVMMRTAGAEKAEMSSDPVRCVTLADGTKNCKNTKQLKRTHLNFWSSQKDKWVGNAKQRQAGTRITVSDTMQTYSTTVGHRYSLQASCSALTLFMGCLYTILSAKGSIHFQGEGQKALVPSPSQALVTLYRFAALHKPRCSVDRQSY